MQCKNFDFKFLKHSLEEREKIFFKSHPLAQNLKTILLSIGGQKVVWLPEEPHLDLLVKNGQNFHSNKNKKVKGEINHCHQNVAKLFLEKNIDIVTGYALSKDRWIQHSWGYDGKKIWETTCLFDNYYGTVLTEFEITKFIISNLGNQMYNFSKEQLKKLPIPSNFIEQIEKEKNNE